MCRRELQVGFVSYGVEFINGIQRVERPAPIKNHQVRSRLDQLGVQKLHKRNRGGPDRTSTASGSIAYREPVRRGPVTPPPLTANVQFGLLSYAFKGTRLGAIVGLPLMKRPTFKLQTAPVCAGWRHGRSHFLAYIEQILAPTLKKVDIVFMANVSIHPVDGVEEAN